MKVFNEIKFPYFIIPLKEHKKIKSSLINAIERQPNTIKETRQGYNVKTDWREQNIEGANTRSLNSPTPEKEYCRILLPILEPILKDFLAKIKHTPAMLTDIWWQQYTKNETHSWHIHNGASWSCVYYLELGEDGPPTLLKDTFGEQGKVITPLVKEGDIIIFPSILPHCSPPNKSDTRKTVIAFNIY